MVLLVEESTGAEEEDDAVPLTVVAVIPTVFPPARGVDEAGNPSRGWKGSMSKIS